MFTITAVTPIRVYNSNENKRQRNHGSRTKKPIYESSPDIKDQTQQIKKLQEQIQKYEDDNQKLKLLANWNLRSTKSALKDVYEMIKLLETYENIKE